MKLKFKIQQYQTDAVGSTVSVFNGQSNLGLIEKGKIACAEKLFEQLSTANVKYGQVDSFDTLMDIVR